MPQPIRLIATDMDDTLLTSAGTITTETMSAIARAKEAGIVFTVATGRSFVLAQPYARQMNLTAPLIIHNGAVVRDVQGTVHHHWPLPPAGVTRLINETAAAGLTLLLFVGDDIIAEQPGPLIDYYLSLGGTLPLFVGDLTAYAAAAGSGLSVTNALALGHSDAQVQHVLPALERTFSAAMEVAVSKPRLVEFTRRGITKGRAVAALAEQLNITPQAVMAIGDSFNDLAMLQYAGIGVAVANAQPAIREQADMTVPSNDEGGVAAAINWAICGHTRSHTTTETSNVGNRSATNPEHRPT